MFKVKHFLETVEGDDGHRFWVEPIGVTRDLRELCKIDQVMDHVGPPRALWEWFEDHPQGYEYFRARYHGALESGPHRQALEQLVKRPREKNRTPITTAERRPEMEADSRRIAAPFSRQSPAIMSRTMADTAFLEICRFFSLVSNRRVAQSGVIVTMDVSLVISFLPFDRH